MIEKTKQWNFMKTIPNLVSTLRYVAHGILAGLLLVIEISSNVAFSICIYLNSDNTPLTKYRNISRLPQKEKIPVFSHQIFWLNISTSKKLFAKHYLKQWWRTYSLCFVYVFFQIASIITNLSARLQIEIMDELAIRLIILLHLFLPNMCFEQLVWVCRHIMILLSFQKNVWLNL